MAKQKRQDAGAQAWVSTVGEFAEAVQALRATDPPRYFPSATWAPGLTQEGQRQQWIAEHAEQRTACWREIYKIKPQLAEAARLLADAAAPHGTPLRKVAMLALNAGDVADLVLLQNLIVEADFFVQDMVAVAAKAKKLPAERRALAKIAELQLKLTKQEWDGKDATMAKMVDCTVRTLHRSKAYKMAKARYLEPAAGHHGGRPDRHHKWQDVSRARKAERSAE